MQIGSEDLKQFVYLRNILSDLVEHREKYTVTAEELSKLQDAANTINHVLHHVKRMSS